jgi:hypothetical protein
MCIGKSDIVQNVSSITSYCMLVQPVTDTPYCDALTLNVEFSCAVSTANISACHKHHSGAACND